MILKLKTSVMGQTKGIKKYVLLVPKLEIL